jgi:hypothetical protein
MWARNWGESILLTAVTQQRDNKQSWTRVVPYAVRTFASASPSQLRRVQARHMSLDLALFAITGVDLEGKGLDLDWFKEQVSCWLLRTVQAG